MKKFLAIITSTLVVCSLCVAPAFADITNTSELKDLTHQPNPQIGPPYYPTDVTDIDDMLGHEVPSPFPYDEDWEMLFGSDIGGLIPIPRYVEGPEPGNYEFHFYDIDIDEEAWLAQTENPTVPTVVTDTEAEDGEHLIEAIAPDEQQAISAVANRVAEVDPDGKTQFGDWESGEILPVIEEKVVVDEQAWTEEIQHEAKTVTVDVIDSPAWTETIEHPAVTHEETVVDEEAWDEQVCTPGTDPYGYKVEGSNRDGFTVEEGAFVLIKQASEYVIIWSEDAEFSDYPTAKEIAEAAKDGSIKNQQVIKWKGLGEFYPGNLGQPWHHWYGFCKNSEGIYFWVDNINGISHADVYVPGKPGECIEVHHDAITHQETIIDEPAWIETIDHEAVTHQETAIIEPAWIEYVNHPEVNHVEQVVVVPGYGWSSITYRLPEVPDVPVVPDGPDNPDPVTPDPIPDPIVTPVEEPEVVIDESEVVVDSPEVYVEQSQTPALPKTADKNDLVVILLAAVAVGAVAVLAYNARRYSKEK